MRLLENFTHVSVVHQIQSEGWEPFDKHNCGPMSLRSLRQCFELIFGKEPLDMECLNRIYTRTAKLPIETIKKSGVVGFKMRFIPPQDEPPAVGRFPLVRNFAKAMYLHYQTRRGPFKAVMFDLLKKHNVVAFVVVRQDVLRWALSKYHGDGSGNPGHIQFDLASGKISKEEVPKINVDCRRLEAVIANCENSHRKKRALMADFKQAGISTYPLLYEDFLSDKLQYFEQIFQHLEQRVSRQEIQAALTKGSVFQKVHSYDMSEYVINHQEVLDRFKGRYVAWR